MTTKTTTLAERAVEWTGTAGNSIAIRVALTETMTDHDGSLLALVRERDGLRITVSAMIDGRERGAGLHVYDAPRKGVSADVGQIVGLTAERLSLVRAAIETVKQHPEWLAHEAARNAAAEAARQHDVEHARIVRAMGE